MATDEDTKMTDSTEEKKENKIPDNDEDEDANNKPPLVPPLQAAALRLERLLDGGASSIAAASSSKNAASKQSRSSKSATESMQHLYTNPAKVVRRWLSTSSGAAGQATLVDVHEAAKALLDPSSASSSLALPALLAATQPPPSDDPPAAASATSPAPEVAFCKVANKEVESWLTSLAVRLLWRDEKYPQAFALAQQGLDALQAHWKQASTRNTSAAAAQAMGAGAASLFPLMARLTRWRSLCAESWVAESASPPPSPSLLAELRQDHIRAHNVALLRRDVDTQAALLNSMLRDLLRHSQIEQAQKLLSNSTFPEAASNNQLCRYLYYSGRIQALRLEYTASFSSLSQCLRKAPTNTALGFRIAAQRLLIVVQLLMGEIPDRHVYFAKDQKVELLPYLHITQAVRRGDLAVFTKVVSEHVARLTLDETYTLISRLAHQVVKAGLRKLHVSYSRLSLQDVADRLGLPSAASAELVVAKAVRDGVLDATIHHEQAYVQSHDLVDVYSTTQEPSQAFHRRIAYCLTTHNDAVRGMRYPPDAYKKQLATSRGQRSHDDQDDKTDEEKAQELEDEFDEY